MKPHCNGYCCSRPGAALIVENEMRSWANLKRSEQMAIAATAVIILAVIALALYGYFSGAWEAAPT